MPAPHSIPTATPTLPVDRFAVCVAHLLDIEGGFVNRRDDHGGPTNFGISLRFLLANAGNYVVCDAIGHNGPPNEADVRALTRDDAVSLYRVFFWGRNSCRYLPEPLDGAVFDQCVNGGGAALLQATLNLFFHGGVTVDGVIGPATLAIVNRAVADPRVGVALLLTSFRTLADARYRAIVRADPSQKANLAGWLARARRLGDV